MSYAIGQIISNARRRSAFSGTITSMIQYGVRMLIGIVSVPLMLNYMGNKFFGLWMAVVSIMSVITFLDAGFTPTMLNKMSAAFGLKRERIYRYYASAGAVVGLFVLLGGLLLLPVIFIVNWSAILHVYEEPYASSVINIVLVLYLTTIVSLSLSFVDNIYVSRMKIEKIKTCSTASSIICFIFMLIALRLGCSATFLILFTSSQVLLYRVILLIELYHKEPILLRLKGNKYLLPLLKDILPGTLAFMGIQLFAVAISSFPTIYITRHVSLEELTRFNIAFRLYNIPMGILASVFAVFWPMFTVSWKKGEKVWISKWLSFACVWTLIAFSVYTVIVLIYGKSIVKLWTLGHVEISYGMLFMLGLWAIVQSITNWLSTFLHSIADLNFELLCYGCTALFLVILSLVLGAYYRINGLLFGMVASLMLGSLFPMYIRVKKNL